MKVGSKSVFGDWDNTFEQTCKCNQFPCDHYRQNPTSNWLWEELKK